MKHPNILLFFLLTALSLLISCSKSSINDQTAQSSIDLNQINPDELPYRLEIVRSLTTNPAETFISADINNDGVNEIISFMRKSVQIDVPSYVQAEGIMPGTIIFRYNFPGTISLTDVSILDINDDDKKEIIVNELKKDLLIIHILDNKGNRIHSFEGARNQKIRHNEYDWLCKMEPIGLMDVNNDGHQDILFEVRTTYAYQPRGIYAYDFFHRKFAWKYRCGFQPETSQLIDINGDGKREILIGSNSPENCDGIIVNGSDDLHLYLTVLDSLGDEISRQPIGGKYSNVNLFIRDMNKDGNSEIIIRFHCGATPKEKDYVAFWQPLTGRIGPKISMEKSLCNHLAFLDVDKDGYEEMLIGWADGTFELRNHRLELG